MKTKIFSLLLALAASVGALWASDTRVNGIWYDFDSNTKEASVTYRGRVYGFYSDEYSGAVTIPPSVTYDNVTYKVTGIGEYAFYDCTGLTSITIPNSVTSIGISAFSGCTGLTSITIPNSVTSIGYMVFYGCTGLTSITIPNSVTRIGSNAFDGCTSLTSITIPNTVTSIGNSAFSGCTGLTSPVFNVHVFAYMPTSYSGAYTIPDGIESIAGYAFCNCTSLASVTIPNSVTSIESDAFRDCTGLTSITIGNSVTSIGELAFYGCTGLTSVTIPNSVTSIERYAFSGCTGLTSITIGNSVTSIGDYAFRDCTGLTSVIWNAKNCANSGCFGTQVESFVFGNEVESIPGSCCSGMSKLASITIPNSVTSIGGDAFSGCTGLTSITISNSVTSLGNWVITNIKNLKYVEAPAEFFNVTETDWANCPKYLETVVVNKGELNDNALGVIGRSYKTLKSLDVSAVSNVEFADEAFKNYYNLEQLLLPSSLEKVTYMMVAGCKNLKSIDIPASVVEIEQSAFEDCRSIETITFGGDPAMAAPGRSFAPAATSQLKRIGNWAFYNAHQLQHLDIPEGVTEIGDGAFYGCTYLQDLVVPSSVQAIGDNCFALCAKMTKITVNSTTPPTIEAKTFFDVKRQIPVYVPDNCVDAYENDQYWSEFNIVGQSASPLGIEEVMKNTDASASVRKVMQNGRLYILRDGKAYTVTGTEVK